MRHLKPTKVILSAYTDNRAGEANCRRASDLISDLSLVESIVDYRAATGQFGGRFEESVICWCRSGAILDAIEELSKLARDYDQHSILVVHGDDATELVEVDTDKSAIIGTFQRTDEPKPGEDFTKIDDSFYVVR